MAQAFVAQLVQLVRPETQVSQMGEDKSAQCVKTALEHDANFAARPDVLMAMADFFRNHADDEEKCSQYEQALARDNFQLFAGRQGVRDYVGH